MAPQPIEPYTVQETTNMNLKSKLFGFGATALLALSITTGAMAADGSTPAHVNLVPRNGGNCSMTVTAGTISFDDRVWTGTAWTNPADSESISGTVTTPSNVKKCDIQAKSAGLNNQSGTGNIGLTVAAVPMTSDYAEVLGNRTSGGWSVSALLDAAGVGDEPGTYQGVIDFQVMNSGQ
jgi:hypothetical protein